MVNSKKTTFLVLCALLVCALVSAFCVTGFTAKADGGFVMNEQGAELRLDQEYGGIRFTAKIYPSDYNAEYSYGMIITPKDYIDEYISGQNPDYIAQFESQSIKIINLTNMTPIAVDIDSDEETDYYLLKGVISNILYSNYNREFFAIAYYNDGESNVYASFNDTENVRSIAAITDSALNDEVFMDRISDDAEQLTQIYSFKYKALYQERGYNENEIKEAAINSLADYYVTEKADIYGTGVLADFDESYYESALVLPSTNVSYLRNQSRDQSLRTIVTDDSVIEDEDYVSCGSGVLKLDYKSGGGVGVRFPYSVTVAADTVINIKVFSHGWNWFRVAKEDALSEGYSLSISAFDQWITKSILATTLGYNVGDTLSEIELYVSSYSSGDANYEDGYFYVDEISYSSLSDLESGLSAGDFEVANYNSTDYQTLSNTGFDIAEDGGNTVLIGSVNGWTNAAYPIAKAVTVTATSQLVVRLKSEFNGVLNANSAKTFGILASYTEISYSMVDDLGYAVNATVSEIPFRNQSGVPGKIYIDSIKIINLESGLEEDVYADFNNAAYSYFVGATGLVYDDAQSGTWKNYEYGARFGTATVDTVSGQSAIKLAGSQYYGGRAIKLAKIYPTVTENTFIKLRVYSTAANLRIGAYKSTTSIGTDLSAKIKSTNQWLDVAVYATDVGFAVGEPIKGINVFYTTNGGAYLAIDYIEVFDLTFDLTGNRVVDFSANRSDYLINAGSVADGVYSYSGVYTPGATIKFAENKTYAEGDFIAINISATKRVSSWNNANSMFYVIENNPDSANWSYAPTSSGVYQTILIPVSKFGYSVGDTVNSVRITNWDSNTLYIRWIDYVSYGDMISGDYVAKYDADSAEYAIGLAGKTGLVYNSELAKNSTWANYEYHSRATVFAIEEVSGSYAVKFSCSNSYLGGSVRFIEDYPSVTADTMIELRVYSTNKNIRLTTYKSTTSIGTDFSSQITANAWSTVTVKATDVGYSVGDKISGINVFGTGGSSNYIAISNACVYELYSTLADGTLVNFNEADRYDSSFGYPGITSATNNTYYYWSHQSSTTRTLLEEGYEGSDGGVFHFHGANYGGTSIKFKRGFIVTDNDYLELRVYCTRPTVRLYKYGADSVGKSCSITDKEWTTLRVKLTDIGYSVGDSVEGIDLYLDGTHDIYIDYVSVYVAD